jgi:DNA-directed RNA polymerase subunit M/transcription elongation factor TFIIS
VRDTGEKNKKRVRLMYKCPKCKKEMVWMSDNKVIEEEVYETHYTCNPCNIDLFEAWGEGVDEQ